MKTNKKFDTSTVCQNIVWYIFKLIIFNNEISYYFFIIELQLSSWESVLVSSASKVSNYWIRNLGFNFRLYQKPINILI